MTVLAEMTARLRLTYSPSVSTHDSCLESCGCTTRAAVPSLRCFVLAFIVVVVANDSTVPYILRMHYINRIRFNFRGQFVIRREQLAYH